MRPEMNSNDFGSFWNWLADSNSISVAAENFLNDSNFWCFGNSITHNVAVYVPVLWPVCAHTIPFRMLWYLWRFMMTWWYLWEMFAKTWNHCGRSKTLSTEHHGKCLTCKIVRYTWVLSVVCCCGGETNRTTWLLFPARAFPHRAETEQLDQVKWTIGGIGDMLFSNCFQTENV